MASVYHLLIVTFRMIMLHVTKNKNDLAKQVFFGSLTDTFSFDVVLIVPISNAKLEGLSFWLWQGTNLAVLKLFGAKTPTCIVLKVSESHKLLYHDKIIQHKEKVKSHGHNLTLHRGGEGLSEALMIMSF